MVPEEELLALKKAVVGNNLDVPYLFAKNDDKQTMPEFEREFQKPVLDLVPENIIPEDLGYCHEFMDQFTEKNDEIKEPEFHECLQLHTPENDQIVKDILSNANFTPQEVISAVKNIPNLKKLKGKVVANPFTKALTSAPIEMSRLDAKFLG